MKQQKKINFSIGAKQFEFNLLEEEKIIERTQKIIEDANQIAKQENKEMFSTENFAYIIFILATNLARCQEKQNIGSQQIMDEKIQKLVEKVHDTLKD